MRIIALRSLALGLLVAGAAAAPAQAALPDRIIRTARAELARGVHEVPMGSNDSPRIARYRTAVRWASGPAAWCGYFVSWVAREAGAPLGEQGEGIGSVGGIRQWAQQTGRWRLRPHRGNIIVFRHGHVGLVERVLGRRWVLTIEGNHSHRVARVLRRRSEIRGFVRLTPAPPGEERWTPQPYRRG